MNRRLGFVEKRMSWSVNSEICLLQGDWLTCGWGIKSMKNVILRPLLRWCGWTVPDKMGNLILFRNGMQPLGIPDAFSFAWQIMNKLQKKLRILDRYATCFEPVSWGVQIDRVVNNAEHKNRGYAPDCREFRRWQSPKQCACILNTSCYTGGILNSVEIYSLSWP